MKILKINSFGCRIDISDIYIKVAPTSLPPLDKKLFLNFICKYCLKIVTKFNFCQQMVCCVNVSFCSDDKSERCSLHEKCLNTEFFLVRIFLYLD